MMQYLWLTKLPFLTAFSVSLMLCIALVRFSQALSKLTRSHDLSSVQAAHTKPTLRLAGVAIFGSMCLADSIYGASGGALRMLLLACLPVFAFGLLEDIGVDQSPARRLIASIISGAIYIALTGSYLSDPGIFWLQPIFDYWFVAIPFTLALLHKSAAERTSPFPGQTYPATSVVGVPRAVKPLRTATRIWTSAT